MIRVDTNTCFGCGVCEANCPFNAIIVKEGTAVVQDNCTLCGTCIDNCEAGALSMVKTERSGRADLAKWSGVWIYAEYRHNRLAPVSRELLGVGKQLAMARQVPLSAVLIGGGCRASAQELIAYGADRVYLADHEKLTAFTDETYGKVLAHAIRTYHPEIVLAGATAIGRSFIPKVATMLGTGLTADCTDLKINDVDGMLLQTRPAFGGNIMATIICPNTRPQMATVRPLVMKANSPDYDRSGDIVNLVLSPLQLESKLRVLETLFSGDEEKINLSEADVVIAGGRGVGGAKGFAMLHELADLLGGAVAASRAAVDSGWIPYRHQVGQTGKTVCPKVYICVGISGAIQHVVGMQSSDLIIAINKDAHAPIFDVATYGIVADAFEIIPKLIDLLKKKRGL